MYIHDKKQVHNVYQLSVGAMLFDKLNVVADLGFKNIPYVREGSIYKNSNTGNFKSITLGMGLDYRFFKSAILSPKIGIAGGFFPYSNLKNKHVDPFSLSMDADSRYIFEKWKSYSSINCFLSIKFSELYVDLGGGLNWQGYSP
jgi:hypothetical protein